MKWFGYSVLWRSKLFYMNSPYWEHICTLHINVLSDLFVGGNGQNNGSKRLGCHRSNGTTTYNMP